MLSINYFVYYQYSAIVGGHPLPINLSRMEGTASAVKLLMRCGRPNPFVNKFAPTTVAQSTCRSGFNRDHRIILACLCLLLSLIVTSDLVFANNMDKGTQAYQQGHFEQAISHWLPAIESFHKKGNTQQEGDAVMRTAEAYQALGRYPRALEHFKNALVLAETDEDIINQASLSGSIGSVYLLTGSLQQAEVFLNQSLEQARQAGNAPIEATTLNNLGNLYDAQGLSSRSVSSYKKAAQLAHQNSLPALEAKILTNLATASQKSGEQVQAFKHLQKALEITQTLDDTYPTSFDLISIGQGLYRTGKQLSAERNEIWRLASKAFQSAGHIASQHQDYRTLSYAQGYQAQLYLANSQHNEAMQLTRQALFSAQQINAPGILYRWQWQLARLHIQNNNPQDAIAAYRQAVQTVQLLRPVLATGISQNKIQTRQQINTLYYELADQLLQQAASTGNTENLESYLHEARNTLELQKATELENYFQDDCVASVHSKVKRLEESISTHTAVLYPVLFKDRTELLVSLSNGLKSFTSPVNAATLKTQITNLRQKLEKRTTNEYLLPAQEVYNSLIRPIEAYLQAKKIDTLVIVPDAALRTIPIAALHDGKQHLIERYALATTPGLELTDPRPIKRENIDLLLTGLTESVQGYPALQHVAQELDNIYTTYGGKLLKDNAFLTTAVEQELTDKPYSIVHIASHGEFSDTAENSFLLTYDSKLTMNDLEQYIGLSKFRDKPVELLTLSACQTAAGDERAALGLAGIAIKAGARSAVASLWQVNDQASSLLISAFYEQLKNPAISKSKALQQAQLLILQDLRYRHAGYWSPFLLIGNWL